LDIKSALKLLDIPNDKLTNVDNEYIKNQYRKLALRWHPDKNTDPQSTEQFQNISNAFQYLMEANQIQEHFELPFDISNKRQLREYFSDEINEDKLIASVLGTLINVVLVELNVRPAMLYQHELEETSNTKIISLIRKLNSNLYFLDINQGTLILNRPLTLKEHNFIVKGNSETKLGEVLGYPCFRDFYSLNDELGRYTVEVIASTTIGDIQIIPNVCNKMNESLLSMFHNIANDANKVLKEHANNDILKCVNNFYVKVTYNPSSTELYNKLLNNETLTDAEYAETRNYVLNMGLNRTFDSLNNISASQMSKYIRGILMWLLLLYKYEFYKIDDSLLISFDDKVVNIINKNSSLKSVLNGVDEMRTIQKKCCPDITPLHI